MRAKSKRDRGSDDKSASRVVESLLNRAAINTRRGEYSRSERYLLRALRLLGLPRGKPTLDHLALWNELGMVYKYAGKFTKARNCYRTALRYCPACLTGSDRYDALASLYHNLGGLEHSLRRFRRAEPFARKSVSFRLKVRPRNAVAITADRVALAAILDGLGKFDESIAIYRGAFKTYRRTFGVSHREIALVLNNLAAAYQRTGRVRRAEEMYRAALEMKIDVLGRKHPDVAVTLNNLGLLLASEKRLAEARIHFERAHRIFSRALGPRHVNSRVVRRNLSRIGKFR